MLTILVWNIEMYGGKFNGNTPLDTLSKMIRDQLIATIVAQSGAQVVLVQELRKNGIERLPTVKTLLSALGQTDWNFDIVEGAVFDGKANYPDFSDVFFSQSANNEGYAVLWRSGSVTLNPITYDNNGTAGTFDQSYGQNSPNREATAPHVIALVNEGYTFQWAPDGNGLGMVLDRDGTAPCKGFIGFPFSNIPNIVGDPAKDGKILNRANTRRPAVVSVTCNDVTFPVVAYHAPVHLNSCIAGTIAALVAKELYDESGSGGYPVSAIRIFAGDLNLKIAANNLSANAVATAGGLTTTMIDGQGNSPGTMVRPVNYFSDQYNDSFYLTTCRDYAFGSAVSGVGINEPVGVLYTNGLLATVLSQNTSIMTDLFGTNNCISQIVFPEASLEGGTWPQVLSIYLGRTQGTVSDNDQVNICSVFYRYFVSDHIPVKIVLT